MEEFQLKKQFSVQIKSVFIITKKRQVSQVMILTGMSAAGGMLVK